MTEQEQDDQEPKDKEEAYQKGYEDREEEYRDDAEFQDTPTPKEQFQVWHKWSRPVKLSGDTKLTRRVVPSVGTTFYPKTLQPIAELYHKINRTIALKESIYARLTEEEKPEMQEERFNIWTRSTWYNWREGNDVYYENVRTQQGKQDSDSLSRRSEDGAFLKEVNAQRRYLDKKKDNPLEKAVRR